MIEKIKKPKVKKEKVVKIVSEQVDEVRDAILMEYQIEATIPTGPYANIKPKITVMAKDLESAEAYVIPHINKLFAEFMNRSERPATCTPPATDMTVTTTATVSTNYARARQAIDSCKSKEAMELIRGQVEKSVKLTDHEKADLLGYISTK